MHVHISCSTLHCANFDDFRRTIGLNLWASLHNSKDLVLDGWPLLLCHKHEPKLVGLLVLQEDGRLVMPNVDKLLEFVTACDFHSLDLRDVYFENFSVICVIIHVVLKLDLCLFHKLFLWLADLDKTLARGNDDAVFHARHTDCYVMLTETFQLFFRTVIQPSLQFEDLTLLRLLLGIQYLHSFAVFRVNFGLGLTPWAADILFLILWLFQ